MKITKEDLVQGPINPYLTAEDFIKKYLPIWLRVQTKEYFPPVPVEDSIKNFLLRFGLYYCYTTSDAFALITELRFIER